MLIKRKPFISLFFVFLMSFLIFSCQNTENSPPVPGVITHFTDVTSNTMVMHWTRASDADTTTPYLEYMVVASNKNNLDTLNNALTNGSVITYDDPETEEIEAIQWHRDIDSLFLSFIGFADGQTYYFTVIVRDAAWRQGAYPMASQKTVDITPPVIGGEISIVNETDESIGLDWPEATDNGTEQALLEYKIIRSNQEDIDDSVEDADRDGEVVLDWFTVDEIQRPYVISSPNTQIEFFTILIRDSITDAANIAIHKAVSRQPKPGGLGEIKAKQVTGSSCTLTWEPATDFKTEQENLQYQVTQISQETTIILSWTKNVTELYVSELTSHTEYSFIVSVRDEDGHEADYETARVQTLVESSQTQSSSLSRGMMSFSGGSTGFNPTSGGSVNSSTNDLVSADAALPLEIAGAGHLLVWLDGADVSGTGNRFEGPVSIWKDKSGMGNDAEQTTPYRQPNSTQSSLFDNKRIVKFDAGNKNTMDIPLGVDLDISGPAGGCTVFIVSRSNKKPSGSLFSESCYFVGNGDSSHYLGMFDTNENREIKLSVQNSIRELIAIPDPLSPFVASLVLEKSNNGGAGVTLKAMGETYASTHFIQPEVINEFLLGTSSGHSDFFDGEIAEFIVFDKVLNEDEHQRMNQYLTSKWGIKTSGQ